MTTVKGILIRELSPLDVESLCVFNHQVHEETYRGFLPDILFEHLGLGFLHTKWTQHLNEELPLLGLFIDDELSGFVSCVQSDYADSDIRIESIYVSKAIIGQGYGSKLFLAMVTELRSRGHKSTYLFVHETNVSALAYYVALDGDVSEDKIERHFFEHVIYSYRVRWGDLGVLEKKLAEVVARKGL